MSSSYLFLGLPIALLILYLVLSSKFQSAAFLNHPSLGDVAILSASFDFVFCESCSSIDVVSISSSASSSMKLHCPRHCESLCSVRHRFHHRCYTGH